MAKKNIEPTIEITQADLVAAYLTWEHQRRAGTCVGRAVTNAMPVEEVANKAAEHVWDLLVNPVVFD